MKSHLITGLRVGLVGAVATIAIVALAASSASAAKPRTSTSTTSTIALNESAPALGTNVTFTTSASGLAGWEWPMVYVSCRQGGTSVYGALDQPSATFQLGGGSSQWLTNGGSADCTATLYAYGLRGGQETARSLASTSFSAAP